MDAVKVVISNDQKAVKIPTGIRMLIRRCCHAVLELENFESNIAISIKKQMFFLFLSVKTENMI